MTVMPLFAEEFDNLAALQPMLKTGLTELGKKQAAISRYWLYYDGDHPSVWMTAQLRELFGTSFGAALQDNYCETAVDAVLSRLEVTGWDGAPGVLADAWEDNSLDLEQSDLYRHALVAGEAFVIVWPSEDGAGFDVGINDARSVHMQMASNKRGDVAWVLKCWKDDDAGLWRITLYTPEWVYRLVAVVSAGDVRPTYQAFTFDPDDPGGPNPFDAVPVVRFARRKNRISRLKSLVPIQDKINKLAANKMVAAEFGAFKQRWMLTQQDIPDEMLRASPSSAVVLHPGLTGSDGTHPTQVGEFTATELSNYDGAIQAEIEKFFTVGTLPRHMMVNPGTSPSGEAVKADEGPFIATVRDFQQMFGGAWTDVANLLGAKATPLWENPVSNHEMSEAQAIKTLVDAGVPVKLALRKVAGWSDEEMAEFDQAVEEKRDSAVAATPPQLLAPVVVPGTSPGDTLDESANTAR